MCIKVIRVLLVLILGVLAAGCDRPTVESDAAASTIEKPAGDYSDEGVPLGRLPRHVVPVHYRLELEIIPERATFLGHTEIDVSQNLF
jgi:hypothetical protein